MRSEHDSLASHIFVSRRHHRTHVGQQKWQTPPFVCPPSVGSRRVIFGFAETSKSASDFWGYPAWGKRAVTASRICGRTQDLRPFGSIVPISGDAQRIVCWPIPSVQISRRDAGNRVKGIGQNAAPNVRRFHLQGGGAVPVRARASQSLRLLPGREKTGVNAEHGLTSRRRRRRAQRRTADKAVRVY